MLARLYGVKLLVLNCHEAWVHQLGALDAELDIVVALPGRYTADWDTHMRPVPANARLTTLEAVLDAGARYDCVINHNITDLLDTKSIAAPKLLVLHETLEGRMAQQDADFDPRDMRAMLNTYLASVGGHAIAISRMKARSWGVTHAVVQNSADPESYVPHTGELACGLRVANHVTSKRVFLAWDFYAAALDGLPMKLVGHNPDMPNVHASASWDDLKADFARHRFYVHTADPRYEDGFNMAMLEAMAAGLPVLTNRHPTTIVEHGRTGYVCDTPDAMRRHAQTLLDNPALAAELGERAQYAVRTSFSPMRFKVEFTRAISEAKKKWSRRAKAVV
ncbi:MAG: glycosyltransferase [Gemmatimonadaceae bacterium]